MVRVHFDDFFKCFSEKKPLPIIHVEDKIESNPDLGWFDFWKGYFVIKLKLL